MTDNELHPILTHYIAWLKSHERILIIGLAAWLAFHFYGSGLNAWIEHDKRKATIEQTKVQLDSTANSQLTQQVADLKQQLATLSAQAQVRQQERIVVVQQQKQKNDQAQPSEVATRTAELLKIEPKEITASNDGLTFSNLASHINVNALEDARVAVENSLDIQNELAGCKALSTQQEQLTAGLRAQLTDEQQSHKADVALEKAKAKKAWRNGFKWGAIAGFIGGLFVTHHP